MREPTPQGRKKRRQLSGEMVVAALSKAGSQVQDRGDDDGFRWRPDLANPKAMNVDAVHRVAQFVADQVAESLAVDGTVLALGADCTVELGTVAGALRGSESVRLVCSPRARMGCRL